MPSATPARSIFRTAARYLTEPHPYGRNPTTVPSHSVPWNIYPKRLVRTGAFVIPMAVVTLGWPLAGAAFFNTIGV